MKIQTFETLLIINEMTKGEYIQETDFFGRAWTEARILAELQDDTVRVIKLNLDTLQEPEDVTEECAKIWLDNAFASNLEIEPDKLPPFVRDSAEWSVWALTVPAPRSKQFSTYQVRNGSVA